VVNEVDPPVSDRYVHDVHELDVLPKIGVHKYYV
jgi:hypothetical protein